MNALDRSHEHQRPEQKPEADVSLRHLDESSHPNPVDFFTNPFTAIRRVHDEMDRAFAQAFGGRAGWSPIVEISEKNHELRVCAELPGLRPEDVKVEVSDNVLIIQGERKQEHEAKNDGTRWHSERHYGRFYRSIPLPEGARAEIARADFKNGELHVLVPLQHSEMRSHQIPIGDESSAGN